MRGLKRLWKKSPATRAHGRVVTAEWFSRKKSNIGPKIYNTQEFEEQLKTLPAHKRDTIRATAKSLDVSTTTVQRWKRWMDRSCGDTRTF